jgi:hypothetical protein
VYIALNTLTYDAFTTFQDDPIGPKFVPFNTTVSLPAVDSVIDAPGGTPTLTIAGGM